MDQYYIIEKGLNIIRSNVRAGINSTGNKEFNRYFILMNQIFKKRLETGLKTSTSFAQKKITSTNIKLKYDEIEAIKFFLNNKNYLEIAIKELLNQSKDWKNKFYLKTNLKDYIKINDTDSKKKIVFFDLETNGFSNCSILSVSAVKYLIDIETLKMVELGSFNRYYFPIEDYNMGAIEVNGLTEDRVIELRGDEEYPEFFKDDEGFYDFIDDVEHLVGHNINFDYGFIKRNRKYKTYCTMKATTGILKIPNTRGYGGYKYPKLIEAAQYYGIKLQEERFHDSDYDVEITVKIFKHLCKNENEKVKIINFLE